MVPSPRRNQTRANIGLVTQQASAVLRLPFVVYYSALHSIKLVDDGGGVINSQYGTSPAGIEQGFELIHTLSWTYQTINLAGNSLCGLMSYYMREMTL